MIQDYQLLSNTTFNLPNFNDRVIQGAGTRGSVGTYKAESLPNISGKTGNVLSTSNQATRLPVWSAGVPTACRHKR